MRILHIPEIAVPASGNSPAPAPSLDVERVDSLERIAKSTLQKLEALEARIDVLEESGTLPNPAASAPLPAPSAPAVKPPPAPPQAAPFTPVTLDAEAVKKGLLANMWKYLNDDERPAKAI